MCASRAGGCTSGRRVSGHLGLPHVCVLVQKSALGSELWVWLGQGWAPGHRIQEHPFGHQCCSGKAGVLFILICMRFAPPPRECGWGDQRDGCSIGCSPASRSNLAGSSL